MQNFSKNTVIINFHDPLDSDSIHLDSSSEVNPVFYVPLEDSDLDDLTDNRIPYENFFPEADALTEFIYDAYAKEF